MSAPRQGFDCAVAGETLRLLPDRALHWPRANTLIVADVHLGKGAAFRRAGVAVPSGGTEADLDRLTRLLEATGAQRLLVLGDLFHTHLSADEPAVAAIDAFRARHAALRIEAIRGNHDRGIERLPARWDIVWHTDSRLEPPFVFAHEPAPDARGYVLAGHIHPVLRLRARQDALRLPVFWFSAGPQGVGVLPSFGAFTGGHPVQPAPGDQLIAVTPDGLVALTPRTNLESTSCMS